MHMMSLTRSMATVTYLYHDILYIKNYIKFTFKKKKKEKSKATVYTTHAQCNNSKSSI